MLVAFLAAAAIAVSAAPVRPDHKTVAGDVTGSVTDSSSGKPLAGTDVLISRNGQIVARTSTDPFGRYTIHDLTAGAYQVEVRLIGFKQYPLLK